MHEPIIFVPDPLVNRIIASIVTQPESTIVKGDLGVLTRRGIT